MSEKVRELLEQQLQLLSERSREVQGNVENLSYLTRAMTDIANVLIQGQRDSPTR